MKGIKKSTIVEIVLAIVIMAGVSVGIWAITKQGADTPEYTVQDNVLLISGSYGAEIALTGADVQLVEGVVLNTTKRVNGSSVKSGERSIAKGKFLLVENEVEKEVYFNLLNRSELYYIKIVDASGAEHYINCVTQEETLALFEKCSA